MVLILKIKDFDGHSSKKILKPNIPLIGYNILIRVRCWSWNLDTLAEQSTKYSPPRGLSTAECCGHAFELYCEVTTATGTPSLDITLHPIEYDIFPCPKDKPI